MSAMIFRSAVFFCVLAIVATSRVYSDEAKPVGLLPVAVPKMEPNQLISDAPGIIADELKQDGVTTKPLAPMNPLTVSTVAADLCASEGLSSIIVPMIRTEQAVHIQHYVLTNIVNYATHVELRLERIRCDGALLPPIIAIGDKSYIFSNVQAGVADAIGRAAKEAAAQYKAHVDDSPSPLFQVPATPQTGSSIALVPFSEPGTPDPSLDYATQQAVKFLNASGTKTVVTTPIDDEVAVRSASAICAGYGASKIVIGFLRSEQTPKFAGIATHAEVFLTTLDCNGKIIAETDRAGDHLHKGANFRSGVSDAINDAFGPNAVVDKANSKG
jgi:hypothetical protein